MAYRRRQKGLRRTATPLCRMICRGATIQLMLAAQRLTNTGGLGAADDPEYARALMRNSHVAMASHIEVPTTDLTIPGPDGLLRTRHYRPTIAEAAPLLVFFHGGGFVVQHRSVRRWQRRGHGGHHLGDRGPPQRRLLRVQDIDI